MALDYFRLNKVDLAIIETGCGGLYDATNIFDNKLLSVITSIGIDHKAILGDTIEEIAGHKAGIIQKHEKVIIGSTMPIEIAKRRMEFMGNCPNTNLYVANSYLSNTGFVQSDHLVDFQKENVEMLFEAVKVINEKTKFTKERILLQEIASLYTETKLNGRLEKLVIDKLKFQCQNVVLDVGHNLQALEKVFGWIESVYKLANSKQV